MLIKDKKLLYHLASLNNIGSILDNGLQPRAALTGFHDVADAEILAGRATHDLHSYVPFHWFACNPFDGKVQKDRPDEDFVLVCSETNPCTGKELDRTAQASTNSASVPTL